MAGKIGRQIFIHLLFEFPQN